MRESGRDMTSSSPLRPASDTVRGVPYLELTLRGPITAGVKELAEEPECESSGLCGLRARADEALETVRLETGGEGNIRERAAGGSYLVED